MPIHYSAKKLNIQCVSSTLATQVPNAVGYAYSNKIKGIKAVSNVFYVIYKQSINYYIRTNMVLITI